MKSGDLIYFIKPHKALYGTPNGSEYYYFSLLKPYKIFDINSTWTLTATIEDMETNKTHFVTKEALDKTITHELFQQLDREYKLNQIL
jgi:hypothetical protein